MREWKRQAPKPSPTVQLSVAVDRQAYKELQLALPDFVKKQGAGHARARTGTLDSGAQLTVINKKELQALGVKKNTIFPLALAVSTVTKSSVDLIGGIFLKFSAYDKKSSSIRVTRQLCYVSRSVTGIYLSEEACIDLGYVTSSTGIGGITEKNATTCHCPRRTLPPLDKPVLPCAPTIQNLPLIKQFILDRFASSAFNTCERQPLPLMDTAPPMRLFVDE